MAHKVFLIHGMGKHATSGQWANDPIAKLKKSYTALTGRSEADFNRDYQFIPLTYDDVFEIVRNKWEDEKKELETSLAAIGMKNGLIKKICDINTWGGKTNFVTTHLLDVILYRFLPDTIKTAIEIKLVDMIRSHTKSHSTGGWSIMAYSLGTAVAHGSLLRNYRPPYNNNAADSGPDAVMMVANVSKVLEMSSDKVYDSAVRPNRPPTNDDGYCKTYISVKNEFDPFMWFDPFEVGTDWPSASAVTNGWSQQVDIDHVHQLNTHDWGHYLTNPEVTAAFFRATLNSRIVDAGRYAKAVKEFTQIKPNKVAKEALGALKNKSGAASELLGFIDMLEKFGDDLK